MKIVISLFTLVTLQTVSKDAVSKALYQTVNMQPDATASADNPVAVPLTPISQYAVTPAIDLKTYLDSSANVIETKYRVALDRLKQQAVSLKAYAKANNYNADYGFLVDMSIPSGKKRFFIYDLKADTLVSSSLVAHGFGSYKENCNDQLVFSNMPYSFKTSVGRYKIGSSYNGTYGPSYKLYGLDSTNNRAYERAIVLHTDKNIPETETFPRRIFQSAGCPAVTPSFLPVIGNYIKTSKKPMLMWIYS
ncbi:MAG: murein L,D-transpeptidase catalytic domain family protein [Chitinophagaceae bacterium]|nr:murein L,D-transpeptidase catalytic domain family protein [Chitinophagaceae bacterium]MBK9531221.1 murein L,D-transpeptidase catalytic domain family protein [Chitinophagaceae bacterium]